jgi:TolB-like protein
MPPSANAVFLSYASQDADVAHHICDALRAAGLVVWFDQSELRGGDAWDASIRRQVKECSVFVPLISASTEARSEGYFRREWNLAVDRMLDMAEDQAFLLPVVIDDTPQATARVPERFRERQWLRFADGEMPPGFVARVAKLLGETPTKSSATPAPRAAPSAVAAAVAAPRRRAWRMAAAVLAGVAIAGAVAIAVWNDRASRNAPAAPAGAPAAPVPDRKSIAVLPFDNLSGRAEDAYLADGLQEEILNALAKLRDLTVISRTSVMEFRGKAHNVRDIGTRLGVGTILEGSIRRDGNTLRLTVQLVDARNDKHLLAVNYDRDLSRVLDLQSAVARQVADSLSATLSRSERDTLDRVATNSGDAYDRYLRAVALFRRPAPNDPEGLIEPKRLLGDALRFDPDYADAHALLSQANTWSFFLSRQPADGAAARKAFERALSIDPQLPEAHLARGMYAMYVTENMDQALADLEGVTRVRPSSGQAYSVLGFALRRRGRMDEALDHFVRAQELDPLNQTFAEAPVITLLGLRRYPEAIEQLKLISARFPNDPEPYIVRASIEGYLQHSAEPLHAVARDHGNVLDTASRNEIEYEIAEAEGRYLDAARALDAIPALTPFERAMNVGFFYAAAGDAPRAQRSFRDAERYAQETLKREPVRARDIDLMVNRALVQSMLGEHASAVASIESARSMDPEARDATNGPQVSFFRTIILVRAGRGDEGYAEVNRLLRVPFGAPIRQFFQPTPVLLLVKDDPRYDELINHPPRL